MGSSSFRVLASDVPDACKVPKAVAVREVYRREKMSRRYSPILSCNWCLHAHVYCSVPGTCPLSTPYTSKCNIAYQLRKKKGTCNFAEAASLRSLQGINSFRQCLLAKDPAGSNRQRSATHLIRTNEYNVTCTSDIIDGQEVYLNRGKCCKHVPLCPSSLFTSRTQLASQMSWLQGPRWKKNRFCRPVHSTFHRLRQNHEIEW